MHTNPEAYLNGILAELEACKADGRNGVFHMNEAMTDQCADAVRSTLASNPAYRVDIRKCFQCTNSYDILVYIIK